MRLFLSSSQQLQYLPFAAFVFFRIYLLSATVKIREKGSLVYSKRLPREVRPGFSILLHRTVKNITRSQRDALYPRQIIYHMWVCWCCQWCLRKLEVGLGWMFLWVLSVILGVISSSWDTSAAMGVEKLKGA